MDFFTRKYRIDRVSVGRSESKSTDMAGLARWPAYVLVRWFQALDWEPCPWKLRLPLCDRRGGSLLALFKTGSAVIHDFWPMDRWLLTDTHTARCRKLELPETGSQAGEAVSKFLGLLFALPRNILSDVRGIYGA